MSHLVIIDLCPLVIPSSMGFFILWKMECSKEKIYFLIESLRRCNYNATQIHKVLRRVQDLCKQYKEGARTSFDRRDGIVAM